jgi:hypothetical protein
MNACRRRNEQTCHRLKPEIDFDLELREWLLLLGLLAGFDDFAETAGVLAVESFLEGLSHGTGANIVGEHADPRDRLQQYPMAADRKDQRTCKKNLTDPKTHSAGIFKIQHSRVN